MTVEEIFSHIAQHMIEGLMTHSQMIDYYAFLGLEGYSKCHEYHYYEENNNYINFCRYYMKHYNRLIVEKPFNNPGVIPDNWYRFARQDVDMNIRKNSIQVGFETWIRWERETKTLYEQYYKELINLNQTAAAMELKKYIIDVDKELAQAEQKDLSLKMIDYNIYDIMVEQEDVFKKYKKKLAEVKL